MPVLLCLVLCIDCFDDNSGVLTLSRCLGLLLRRSLSLSQSDAIKSTRPTPNDKSNTTDVSLHTRSEDADSFIITNTVIVSGSRLFSLVSAWYNKSSVSSGAISTSYLFYSRATARHPRPRPLPTPRRRPLPVSEHDLSHYERPRW